MADELTLAAEPREVKGTGASGRLRRSGVLPAVVYSDGKEASMIQVREHEISQMLRYHTGGNLLVNLNMSGGGPTKVLLKDVQHHPVSGRLLHADFHEISMTKKITVSIAIELVGTPEGVTQQGGVLEQTLREVEVECLPTDLVDKFELDISHLMINDHLNVSDIPLGGDNFALITGGELAVAHVSPPRVEAEPDADEEGEVAEGEEGDGAPEVIGEKKEEASEGEGGE